MGAQRLFRKSILCIDDDASCLEVHKKLMEEAGYEVFDCADSEQGLSLFSFVQVDLVVLDYSMPVLNGAQVASAMHANRPGVPIIMISEHAHRPDDLSGAVDAYLDKAQGFEAVLLKIEELLGKTSPAEKPPGAGRIGMPRAHRPFSTLQGKAREHFEKMGMTISHARGERIFAQDEMALSVFVLCSGRVTLTATSRKGETSSLRVAEAGDILGLSAALNGSAYEVTAEVLENCRFRTIRSKEFMRFLEKYPEASLEAARCIVEEYRTALNDIQRLALI